jgi:hypothetical protein
MWFTAHVIMWLRFKEGPQDYFPAEEDLLLVSAPDGASALREAERLARERYAGDDGGSLRCDGRPAERMFGSIRHLIRCQDEEEKPDHGTELSYQYVLAQSRDALDALIAGQDAPVLLKQKNDPDLA